MPPHSNIALFSNYISHDSRDIPFPLAFLNVIYIRIYLGYLCVSATAGSSCLSHKRLVLCHLLASFRYFRLSSAALSLIMCIKRQKLCPNSSWPSKLSGNLNILLLPKKQNWNEKEAKQLTPSGNHCLERNLSRQLPLRFHSQLVNFNNCLRNQCVVSKV